MRDKSTNRIVQELWYNLEGQLARPDDLPTRVTYDQNGRPREMAWGQAHRENGPSEVHFNPDNAVVTYEVWCYQGHIHRADGEPAVIYRDKDTGAITSVEFYNMGKRTGKKLFQKNAIPMPQL